MVMIAKELGRAYAIVGGVVTIRRAEFFTRILAVNPVGVIDIAIHHIGCCAKFIAKPDGIQCLFVLPETISADKRWLPRLRASRPSVSCKVFVGE